MTENSLNILVIDDDAGVCKLVQNALTKEGYKVDVCTEAPQGLQTAVNSKPDVVVLDVMMPVINGYNVCRLLKTEESTKDIPVILLTSRSEHEDVSIGMDMGADAYLIKPVDIPELVKTIKLVRSANPNGE